MADQDPESGSTETQAATPETSRPRFGAGLTESDRSPSPSTAVAGPSEDANPDAPSRQEPDWDKIDLERVNPDELPEHLKPAQSVVKRLRADYTRKTTDLARQREQLETQYAERERRLLESIQRTQPQPAGAVQEQLDVLQQLAADPSLSPEDRRGLEAVDRLIKAQIGTVASENQQLREHLERVNQQLGLIAQERQAQQARHLAQDQKAAEEAFGAEAVAQYLTDPTYAALIRDNYGKINPRTGEAFNLTALLELFTGRQADQIAQAREGQQQARQEAKRRLGPRAGATSTADTGGRLSKGEAEARVAKIFGL